ncbi:MAG: hypothetical protein SGPRY_003046 [Prymnesium sp.]
MAPKKSIAKKPAAKAKGSSASPASKQRGAGGASLVVEACNVEINPEKPRKGCLCAAVNHCRSHPAHIAR